MTLKQKFDLLLAGAKKVDDLWGDNPDPEFKQLRKILATVTKR